MLKYVEKDYDKLLVIWFQIICIKKMTICLLIIGQSSVMYKKLL